jgi:lipopolysaccharide/colanic/teichoic acid biosynthesis glycosyltransferase
MNHKRGFYEKYIKRVFDIICALLAIILFCWLYAIIAVLVRVKLGSPVLFKQPRPGKDEKIFNLYKFRTMTDERDENGELLPDEVRLTSFGKWLRSTSMDELPEAFNILNGTMSVIGPRPQLVRDMTFMTAEQRRRHCVRPGLSGLAQTRGRNALSWDGKLATDLEYIEHVTFLGDVRIIFDTVKQVFFKQKGIGGGNIDEVDITDDFGDYLLKAGRVSKEEYEAKQTEARELLGV